LRPTIRAAAFGAVAAIGAAGAAGLFAWRAVAPLAGQREQVLASVSNLVGLPIRAESVEVSWLPPAIVARELSVPDESPYGPGTLAYAEEARFDLSLVNLLRGRLVVDEVRLQAPVVRAVRGADGGWNLRRRGPAAPSAPRDTRPATAAPGVSVETVRVRGGRLVLRDRGVAGVGEHELRDVNLRLRRGSSGIEIDFDGQALGGSGRNLAGSLRVPLQADAKASFELEADRVEGARVAELVSLLRGRLPFGVSVEGPLDVRVEASAPAAWPPEAADIRVETHGRDASLRHAGGWIGKPAGDAFEANLRLRAAPGSLALLSADLAIEGGRIQVREEPDARAADQPPLSIAADSLDARALARWVPSLSAVDPSGNLSLAGRVEPGRPTRGRLDASGAALRISVAGAPVDLGDGRIRLDLDEDGPGLAGSVEIARISGEGGRLGGVEGRVSGDRERVRVELAAREGDWRGAALERVALEGAIVEGGLEIRAVRADALGGTVAARGRIARIDGGRWSAAIDPRVESIDLAGLLSVAGSSATGRGRVAGSARLVTTGVDLRESVRNLSGDFDLVARDGEIGGLNVAGTTLSGLRGVPGLRDAVLRGARRDAPGLVAPSGEFAEMRASGRVGDGAIEVESLRLRSDDYRFDARGRIGFDGATDLDGELEISRPASKAIVSESGLASLLSGSDGLVTIPIVLRGAWPSLSGGPTPDFASRLARRAVGGRDGDDLGGLVKRFLGGRAGKGESGPHPDAPEPAR